jgi:hypothetical protein
MAELRLGREALACLPASGPACCRAMLARFA